MVGETVELFVVAFCDCNERFVFFFVSLCPEEALFYSETQIVVNEGCGH